MKKIICLIIALASFAVLGLNAFAAGSVTASQQSEAYKGKSFNVDIILSDNPGLTRLDVKVTYNSKQLSCTSAKHSNLFSTCGDQSSSGTVKLSYSSDSNDYDTGKLATLRFNAIANADTTANITVEVTKALNSSKEDITINGGTTAILIVTEPTEDDDDTSQNDVVIDESDIDVSLDEVDENETTTAATTKATEKTTEKTTKKTTEKTTKKTAEKTTEKTTKATTTEPTTTPEPTTTEDTATTPETTTAPEPATEPDSQESSAPEVTEPPIETDPLDPAVSGSEEPSGGEEDISYEVPEDFVPASAKKENSHKGLLAFGIIAAVAVVVIGGVVIYMRRSE